MPIMTVVVHLMGHFCDSLDYTLNSAYNKVTFNEKLVIAKENLHTKYTPFTYNDVTLNKKPPIMKQISAYFFIIGRVSVFEVGVHAFFAKHVAVEGNLWVFYLTFFLLNMRPLLFSTCIKLSRLLLCCCSYFP